MAKPTPGSSRSPSPAILSILAILVSSTANAAPPAFLCPPPNYNIVDRHIPSTTITPFPPQRTPARCIPNKFVRGDDGFWTRVESYTLYGSTVPYIRDCPSPTQIASEAEDGLQVLADHPPFASSTPTEDIRNSLPLGWKPTPKPNERTPLILSLSLVLALFIGFFIIGCLFWRKSIIKQRRRDLEAEFKKGLPSTADEPKDLVEKESRSKQKVLARATARWKANIRHAARQRKGKRVVASKSPQVDHSSHSSNDSRTRLPLSVSLPRPSSRSSSVISISDPPQSIIGQFLMSPSHDTIPSVTTSPYTNVPSSPPAYHHGGQASPIIYSNISHATPLNRSRRPSPSSSFRAKIDPHNSGISMPKPFHAAHVATDDKALLARLADLASRPPEDASTDTLDVSAPAWHDELPFDLVTSDDRPPDITRAPCSLFPPPPSKEHKTAADLYEYSFSFEDMAALGPEPEPSAPPFQLDSAFLLDDHQIVPSAPPIMDDPELFVDVHPSAPPSCQLEENPMGQDHDRIRPAEVPLSLLPPSANVQPVSTSRQEIGTVHDIKLPGYRP
ncbi:hypothetical protein BYT27DRAFT_7190019 [Phlegmacium glaucopus]|nr:hypothetical protein BYT27DRAFT_7190019 [Phlegmacium glaucopus]